MRRAAAALLILSVSTASADEGFWPFGRPPIERIKAATGVEITQDWLDEARLSVVRVNDAGSGSFVSRSGLLLTNHHVVVDVLETLSTETNDIHIDGFRALTQAEEIQVPVEVLTLESMIDVSTRVAAAMNSAATPAEAIEARDALLESLGAGDYDDEGFWTEASRHNDQVWLYRFREYEDVRLVFAPTRQAAYFAYQDDRVKTPGHWLDMVALRVYGENGEPLETPHYFPFDLTGGQENEPVFLSGFPWKTERGLSMAQTKLEKKFILKDFYERNEALRDAYKAYAALGGKQARAVRMRLWDAEDGSGGDDFIAAYSDPKFLAREKADEQRVRDAIEASPVLKKEFGTLYDDIEATQKEKEKRMAEYQHRALAADSSLAQLAVAMVRYARESAKPEAERTEDLDALKGEILEEHDIFPGLEEQVIGAILKLSKKNLGDNDPFVQAALQGAAPADLARRVVAGTTLADPKERERLLNAGSEAILKSADPLLKLAGRVRDYEEEVREWYNDKIAPSEEYQKWMMARVRAAIDPWASPDADWGLRLSYGKVRGYTHKGKTVPHNSRLGGLFDQHDSDPSDPDFALDPFYKKNRSALDKRVAMNGLADTDIAGGNSGSGVVNGSRSYVGIVFATADDHLVSDYEYDKKIGRSMFVDSRGILEVLKNGYGMTRIVNEITRDAVQTIVKPPAPAHEKISAGS